MGDVQEGRRPSGSLGQKMFQPLPICRPVPYGSEVEAQQVVDDAAAPPGAAAGGRYPEQPPLARRSSWSAGSTARVRRQ
ncbi:hypothetical protein AB0F59_26140 [Micromonospora lupini]|uniref:hypothetical protein n=1 Tax=Micromonospora lupini TaxID=285679 RepID=UPI0033C76F37